MKNCVLILLLLVPGISSIAQEQNEKPEKVYKLNYWVDLPVMAANFGYSQIIYNRMGEKYFDTVKVKALNKDDINWFDRVATQLDYEKTSEASSRSDFGVTFLSVLPVALMLDKEIRRDWLDIALLYGEAHSFNLLVYSVAGPNMVDRYRPLLYYSEEPLKYKIDSRNMNSFFSGHTSTTATCSFFMAKVYSDYHPELGKKKFLVYAAASIPPALVGYYRVKAAKHFPSDVIVGITVGAAAGILVPHFHKIKKNERLSLVPYSGSTTGLYLSYKF